MVFAELCVACGSLTAGRGQRAVIRPAEDDRRGERGKGNKREGAGEPAEGRGDKKQREETGVYVRAAST